MVITGLILAYLRLRGDGFRKSASDTEARILNRSAKRQKAQNLRRAVTPPAMETTPPSNVRVVSY